METDERQSRRRRRPLHMAGPDRSPGRPDGPTGGDGRTQPPSGEGVTLTRQVYVSRRPGGDGRGRAPGRRGGRGTAIRAALATAALLVLRAGTGEAFGPAGAVGSREMQFHRHAGRGAATALGAVRKRAGDHRTPSAPPPLTRASRARSASAAVRGRRKPSDAVLEQLASREPAERTPPKPGSRKRNESDAARARRKDDRKARFNERLRSLLANDADEALLQPYRDDSPEAADQVADLRSYGKLSEEARLKAKEAVREDGGPDDDGEEDDGGGIAPAGGRGRTGRPSGAGGRVPKVRATVSETGTDSMGSYIKSLGRHELLTREDEVLLGRQVGILTELEDRRLELEEEMLRPPTFAQWAEATDHTVPSLKQQIRRSHRAKAALIEANLRLVITVARQATKRRSPSSSSRGSTAVQFQDACQQGVIGLTRATEKFNPDLGFRFSTYATWWIQKEVRRNVDEQSRTVRVPQSALQKINDIRIKERVLMTELGRRPHDEELAEKCGMTVTRLNFYRNSANEVSSLDRTVDARRGKGSMSTGSGESDGATMDTFVRDTGPTPADVAAERSLREDVRRLVKTLSPREQAVIRLRFGLDDGSSPRSIPEISRKFGVDEGRVRRIESSALLKLRQPNRSSVVECYVSDQ